MPDAPNIVLVMTDQHRGDAIGADPACPTIDGDPAVHTPNLNHRAQRGSLFSRGYTPIPSCVPARRCLWTGQTPATNGCPKWVNDEWDFEATLPGLLTDDGYQTRLVGKNHARPMRNHCGFEHVELHDGRGGGEDDYAPWLDRQAEGKYDEVSHGCDRNSWDPRPTHLPEHEHPTNWTTERALDFLDQRDPTRPFFLTVSYVRPHQPFDPPQPYWDMYIDRDLPEPPIGDWVEEFADELPEHPPTQASRADLPDHVVHRAIAGYYGLITHLDHQIQRILGQLPDDTIFLFTSDHGEMLGDHHHWRKTYAYEGSARVPFVVDLPDHEGTPPIDAPVGLEDVAPTLLDAACVDVPDTMEGRSVVPLIEGSDDWRDAYHGEHGPIYDDTNACHYLVEERWKYVWNPVTGTERLFDLAEDPDETADLSDAATTSDTLDRMRATLRDRLADRPEGFVQDGALQTVDPEAWDVWDE